jgi:hypothetical protein
VDYQSLLTIGLFSLVIWFWVDSTRAKEAAVRYCKHQCDKEGGQLLDQTVQLSKLRLQRNRRGVMQFRREYSFDYSYQGDDRLSGYVVMLGLSVQLIHMDRIEQNDEAH